MKRQQYRVTYAKAVHGKEELQAVVSVMNGNATIMGPMVKQFEQQIAKLFAKKFGSMVNSGSSANLIATKLMQLPEGSEVITPILTFSTTVSPLVQNGLIPVFCDVDEATYQINTDQVEEMITKKTKALVIPSLLGNIPDLPRLRDIANKHKLYVFEDSCDTLGATINKKSTGSFSDISTTSFYGSHIITAAGNGGMVCVNNPQWDSRSRVLRGWGRSSAVGESNELKDRFGSLVEGKPYDTKFIFEEMGYNFLPNELGAAFGLEQVKKLEKFKKIRQHNFKKLKSFFEQYADIFIVPEELRGVDTAWLAFPLTIRKGAPFVRYELVSYLEKNQVQTRPVFSGNLLRHPGFKNIPAIKRKQGYPVADFIMQNSILIGCHHGMDDKQGEYMLGLFSKFLKQKGIQSNE
jgi:CDP-6-deoxy-D-xylo-4-hexulose-3-dehydrase